MSLRLGDIRIGVDPIREKRGEENRQGGVLGPADADAALEPPAAVDDDFVHLGVWYPVFSV